MIVWELQYLASYAQLSALTISTPFQLRNYEKIELANLCAREY